MKKQSKKGGGQGAGGRGAPAPPSRGVNSKKAVQLSTNIEQEVKDLLQDLSSLELEADPAPASTTTDARKLVKQYTTVYDALIHLGFTKDQVQQGMATLVKESRPVREDVALDWLCYHLPPDQLPRRFAAMSRTTLLASQVRILSTAQDTTASGASGHVPEESGPSDEDEGDQAGGADQAWDDEDEDDEQEEDEEDDQERLEMERAEQQQKEKADADAAKAWIRQQYLAGSDEEEEGSGDDDQVSSAGSIDDWELWADPREVERRKQERARAKLPPEVRRNQVAHELSQAKDAAAAAKTSGDKERQKNAGAIIRQLKAEMEQLGLTEEQAMRIVAQDKASKRSGKNGDAGEQDEFSGMQLFDDDSAAATQQAAGPAAGDGDGDGEVAVDKATAGAAEDWEPQFDLFDAPAEPSEPAPAPAATKATAAAPPEPLLPWGMSQRKGARPPTASKPGQPPPAADKLQPKALLSQQCQKQGWQQPRYNKLHDAASTGTGVRYSVTISMGVARGAARKKGWEGLKTFQLPPDQDIPWPSIQDAQNAAATRALYELFGSELPLHQSFGPPFQDMWITWETSGEALRTQDAETEQQAKLEFVSQLVATRTGAAVPVAAAMVRQVAAADRGAAAAQAPQDDDDTALEEWEANADAGVVDGEAGEGVPSAAAAAAGPEPYSQAEKQLSAGMKERLTRWWSSPAGEEMGRKRAALPISAVQAELHAALAAHDVVLVCGDTGCGKTTQIPQYILEVHTLRDEGARTNVICTQPRRIAAISVADRVAVERGEPQPGSNTPNSTVGYQVRLDSAVTAHTRLTFCTTGILLRRMASDPHLRQVTHVVIDEVHERSMQGDFLMALVKDLVAYRRSAGHPLKVILMSATLEAATFQRYMSGCPLITAQGRTFPVTCSFLEDVYQLTQYRLAHDSQAAHRPVAARASAAAMKKQAAGGSRDKQALLSGGWGDDEVDAGPLNPLYDPDMYSTYDEVARRNMSRVNEEVLDYDLLEELIRFIDETEAEGAILVFLPGMGEISNLSQRLLATRRFRQHGGAWLRVLHSGVSPEEQRAAFVVPPAGVRKVVLATNIAETSLTIEDVVYVVDSGRHKERRYDAARHMSMLVLDWVSRASALQRRGRAGRVRPGKAYCLYTKHRFENTMRAYGAPEMVRVPLEELALQIHALQLGPVAGFLERVLEPPPAKAVAGALSTLSQVGALIVEPGREELTSLGQHLAQLPVDPRLGKLLVLGAVLGCLAPAATVAAALSHKSPFLSGATPDKQDDAQSARRALADKGSKVLAAGQQSDHLLLVSAFDSWIATLHKPSTDTAETAKHSKHKGGKHGGGGGHHHRPHDDAVKAASKLAKKMCLNEQVLHQLQEMRVQLAGLLADVGLVPKAGSHDDGGGPRWLDDPHQPWNKYAHQACVVKAVLCAALSPSIAVMSDASTPNQPPLWLSHTGIQGPNASQAQVNPNQEYTSTEEVFLHPSCVAHGTHTRQLLHPFLAYLEKVKTSRVFLRDVTPVSPVSLMLFGGPLSVLHAEGIVLVNGWIRVRAAAQTAVVVRGLRAALDRLLQAKVRSPKVELQGSYAQVIPTIVKLLEDEDKQRLLD